jgi:hypothetical protein
LGSPAFAVNLPAENSSEIMGGERRINFAVDDFSWTNSKHLIIIDFPTTYQLARLGQRHLSRHDWHLEFRGVMVVVSR